MLKTISSLPISGICAFINESTKSVYFLYSRECAIRCCREIIELKSNKHKSRELQDAYNANLLTLVSVEDVPYAYNTIDHGADLRSRYGYHITQYRNAGYADMRNGHNPGCYKIKINVDLDYKLKEVRVDESNRKLVYVEAVSSRYDRIVLGVFNKVYEAESWIGQVYPQGFNNDRLIRANNAMTKNYYRYVNG